MAKSKKRQNILQEKRNRKAGVLKSSGSSNYARKNKYLTKLGKFGFECIEKPWKIS